MNKFRSLAVFLASVLVTILLFVFVFPYGGSIVYASGDSDVIEVSTYNDIVEAVTDTDNAGKTIKLLHYIDFGESPFVIQFPVTIDLNGIFIFIPNITINVESKYEDKTVIFKNGTIESFKSNDPVFTVESGHLYLHDLVIIGYNTSSVNLFSDYNKDITISCCEFQNINCLFDDYKAVLGEGQKTAEYVSYGEPVIAVYADLTIAGVIVTEDNCNDILGNGVFKFSYDTNTLFINGDYDYNGTLVKSYIQGLMIYISKTSTIGGSIILYGETYIVGNNHLTINTDGDAYFASFTLNSSMSDNEIVLRFINVSVEINGHSFIDCDHLCTIVFEDSEIIANTDNRFISCFKDLEFYDCDFEDPDKYEIVNSNRLVTSDSQADVVCANIIPSDYWYPVRYDWSSDNSECTASRTFKYDSTIVEKEKVATTSAVKTPATTSAMGTTTYTAKFENEAFETQSKDVQDIPVIKKDDPVINPDDPVINPDDPVVDPVSPSFADFVERLYVVALGRASEPEGKAFWSEHVGNGDLTGAACANEFLLSKEFNDRGLNDEQFLTVLYSVFFNREAAADPDGFNFWMNSLKTQGRDVVVDCFINSTEWCNVCATYGVKSGATRAKATIASENAKKFATRLYTECLGREPETEGLNFWALGLTNLELTGSQAAHEFFFCKEFNDHNFDNKELITRMYRTFMGREPDDDGMAFWLDSMSKGLTKQQVFDSFVKSPEFTQICKDYAIERG